METEKVDLNRATKEELMALPQIGEVLAERIIAARPLTSVEDLATLPGFRERVIETIRPLVTVEAVPEDEAPSAEEAAQAAEVAPPAEALPPSEEAEDAEADAEDEAQADAEAEAKATVGAGGEAEVGQSPPSIAEAEVPPTPPPAPSAETPPSPNFITRTDAWRIAVGSSLVAFILAFALALGVLQALNGTLIYASDARYRITERKVQALQDQVGDLQLSLQTLQRQVNALQDTASQVQQLADGQERLQAQADALEESVAAIQASAAKFDTFLKGLQDLLNGIVPPAAPQDLPQPDAPPTP